MTGDKGARRILVEWETLDIGHRNVLANLVRGVVSSLAAHRNFDYEVLANGFRPDATWPSRNIKLKVDRVPVSKMHPMVIVDLEEVSEPTAVLVLNVVLSAVGALSTHEDFETLQVTMTGYQPMAWPLNTSTSRLTVTQTHAAPI
ncbi:hypothetical protein KIH74_30890 [Kineosporia sp. J2-2]|uniref:Uncharacterized protein n=1 Tax=Kineosporia corallincola TaxID=2835133 RepID=A0ABS5TRH0_9ACTN|nr:hypothetical protein [Kineosporia corallincola]MBT0773393.1 hypothetical protein [Kineosporia corallincola]